MRMNVTITGTRELDAKLKGMSNATKGQVLANALMVYALDVVNAAKGHAPVDTGNLRRSLGAAIETSTPTSATAIVGTDVEYAPYQEFGTRRMPAHPYLRPAVDETRGNAPKVIGGAIKAQLLASVG